jgi:CheY-like chemotaxis protein
MPGRKILVVDDEVEIVRLLTDYLAEQGYEVVTAHGGIEALAKLDAEKPLVVLLDVRMPGMDGIEVLRRIRSFNQDVGILMITANEDIDLAKEALALGAYDYTLKPVDFQYLSRAVEKMMAAAPSLSPGVEAGVAVAPSGQGLLYELALQIFRVTRALSPVARESVGHQLEQAGLAAVQLGMGGDKHETVRLLNQIRTVLRFAKDLGDISDDTHRALEAHLAKARRSVGLS